MACKICYNPSCSGNCIGGKPNKALVDLDFKLCTNKPEVPRLDPIGKLDCDDKNCNDEVTRQITIVNNNTSGGGGEPIDFEHNNLLGLQGGNLLERYHIEKNIYDSLQDKGLNVNNKVVSQTDLENWKVTSNLSLGDVNELTVSIANDSGSGVTLPSATPTKAGVISSYDKSKLDGIEIGAQKNVKTDWEATSGDAELLNKPSEFPPSPHTHDIVDVNGLQTSLDLKEDKSNKTTSLNNPNNTTYPTTLAVANALQDLNSPVTSVNGKIGDVVITKTDINLGDVDNTSDLDKPISNATQAVLNNKIDIGEKGAPNGVASLDGDGLIPVEQLPPHSHTPPDISIGQNLFLVGDVNGVGSARKILPSDVDIFVPNGVAVSNSTGSDNWQIRQADANPTALTIPIRSSTGRLKVGDATEFNDAVTLTQMQDGLFTKVDKTTTVSGSGGITIGGSLESGAVSIGVNDTYFNNKYLRKDVSDNNGSNTLTLGKLITPDASIGQLELNSLGTGTGTDEILVIDSSGIVKKKSAASDVNIGIANNLGANQFFLGSTSQLQFEGAGDTSISFNPATNKVTITSIPGAGGGGAVTSFNGRTGGVSPESGDYSTTMVTEGTNLYFTEGRVRLTPLTGLSNSNTPITATDNVLQGFGKLQGQMNTKASSSRNLTVSGTAGRIIVGGGTQDLSADREWTVDLIATGVSAGVYTKVAVDSYGRVYTGGMLTVSDIPTNLPYRSDSWVPTWNEVTEKPLTFTPSAHTHPISQVTDLQSTLDGKANTNGNNASGTWPIDISGTSYNSALLSGYAVGEGIVTTANTIAKRDANGYLHANYIRLPETISAGVSNTDLKYLSGFKTNDDGYLYAFSNTVVSDFVRSGASGLWPINITGDAGTWNGASRSSTVIGPGYNIEGLYSKLPGNLNSYPINAIGLREFLGSPANGETWQSVLNRGSTAVGNAILKSPADGGDNALALYSTYTGGGFLLQGYHSDEVTPKNLLTQISGGNFGIGTTNPTEKLQVAGTIKGEGYVTHNINGSWSSYIAVGNELRWYSNEISAGDRMTLNASGDLNVTGIMSALGGNSTQWNQAYANSHAPDNLQSVTDRGNSTSNFIKITGVNNVSNGDGLELFHSNGESFINSYGRGTSNTYLPLSISAQYVNFNQGGITVNGNVAATGGNSTQWNQAYSVTQTATPNIISDAVVKRDGSAQINVPTTPTSGSHATSKAYVDGKFSDTKVSSYFIPFVTGGTTGSYPITLDGSALYIQVVFNSTGAEIRMVKDYYDGSGVWAYNCQVETQSDTSIPIITTTGGEGVDALNSIITYVGVDGSQSHTITGTTANNGVLMDMFTVRISEVTEFLSMSGGWRITVMNEIF